MSNSGCSAISSLLVDDCNSVQCLLSASASFFNDFTNALIFRFSSSGQSSSSTMSLADSGRLRKTSFTIAKCVVGRIFMIRYCHLRTCTTLAQTTNYKLQATSYKLQKRHTTRTCSLFGIRTKDDKLYSRFTLLTVQINKRVGASSTNTGI